MLKFRLLIVLIITARLATSQEIREANSKGKPEYFRKEEIIYYGKRYRVHNNYLSFGPGFLNSSIRTATQKSLGIDFQFHIVRQQFQAGVMMSGPDFGSNNNVQAHFGYGYRRETKTSNFSFYAGPTYFTGVVETNDPVYGKIPRVYTTYGVYGSVQLIYKLAFDIGLGAEAFGEYSSEQTIAGVKLIAFFSGAYVGKKRNYNPNVRTENPR